MHLRIPSSSVIMASEADIVSAAVATQPETGTGQGTGTGLVAVRSTPQADATPATTSSLLGVELHCPMISPGTLPELTLARVRNHFDRPDALERSPKLRRPASRR